MVLEPRELRRPTPKAAKSVTPPTIRKTEHQNDLPQNKPVSRRLLSASKAMPTSHVERPACQPDEPPSSVPQPVPNAAL